MYKVETTPRFDKEFKKLDKYTQKLIKGWVIKNLTDCVDPRKTDKELTGNRRGQWRYRIGDYRLICHIDDNKFIILALCIGLRREVYRDK